MLKASPPTTSTASRLQLLSKNDDIDMEEDNDNDKEDDLSLWSIEDDTMFCPKGLMNHSAGKGKCVFVSWNENYLLNFVFKTSTKTRKTSLTKVRLTMPIYEKMDLREEIESMLILEMNTLLHMKSGRVYYFSSVKSMHPVEWLTGVRTMSSCPRTQFSVIRLVCGPDIDSDSDSSKILSLEVYRDIPQLGKLPNGLEVLRHSYDINFDMENIFNCNWLDERYTLLSLIACNENLEFLQQLVAMGNIFRTQDESMVLVNNQEVHIFTVSGNVFILIGALISESESLPSNPEIKGYDVQLLNSYASNIECVNIDVKRNLVIVLLQSGHMDIWYKSNRMFGALLHHQRLITPYLHYDFRPSNNTFYFVTSEDVIQLQILTAIEGNTEDEECVVQETHKPISGMIACTWVESLQQLVCLSFNNIFYRLCFEKREQLKENETHFESLNKLYALTTKRVKDLMGKAQIVNELSKQPGLLHQAIEDEFLKQQLLAMGTKCDMFQKLYQCYVEYHVNTPGMEYFPEDCIIIKTKFNNCNMELKPNSVYCLIFLSLRKKKDFLLSVLRTPLWHILISDRGQSLLLHVPSDILHKNICFIVKCSLNNMNKMLPELSLNILTFLNHCSSYVSVNLKIAVKKDEKTFRHIFSHNTQILPLIRNVVCDIDYLLQEFTNSRKCSMDYTEEKIFQLKYCLQISNKKLENILEKLHIKLIAAGKVCFTLYFLYQHLIELQYDAASKILTMYSQYPEALFYIKLWFTYESKSCNDVINLTDSMNIQQMILQHQCDIERLYGTLTSTDYMDNDSSTNSIHLENISQVYLKLRTDFSEVFR